MKESASATTVVRFGLTERLFHWMQAIPYLVLLVSGGLLLLQRQSRLDLVSTETLAQVHLVCGFVLPVAILLAILGGDTGVHWQNTRFALHWRPCDLLWLILVPLKFFSRNVGVPPAGKFNAGQKLHLVAQMALIPLFLGSGLVMWQRPGILLAWYVHVICFGAVVPLLLGHLYLALLHPKTRRGLPGIFTGRVDREWAREHHELEYPAAEEDLD